MGAVPVASQVALVVKNTPASAGDLRDLGSIPGSGLIPGLGQSLGDGHWNPLMGLNPLIGTHHVHGLSMPRESHGQRDLVGYSPWGHRVGHD